MAEIGRTLPGGKSLVAAGRGKFSLRLVGTLMAVGSGKLDPDAMPDVLAARDRSRAGPVAPPHGLTLERVVYGRPGR